MLTNNVPVDTRAFVDNKSSEQFVLGLRCEHVQTV